MRDRWLVVGHEFDRGELAGGRLGELLDNLRPRSDACQQRRSVRPCQPPKTGSTTWPTLVCDTPWAASARPDSPDSTLDPVWIFLNPGTEVGVWSGQTPANFGAGSLSRGISTAAGTNRMDTSHDGRHHPTDPPPSPLSRWSTNKPVVAENRR